MAFDQLGNYIPDQFGGQPVVGLPMQNMNPQAMPMQAQAPVMNTTPVVAAQRPSIAPMGVGGGGAQPSAGPAGAAGSALTGLAQGLRNMQKKDKDGNPIPFDFANTNFGKAAYGIGDLASAGYDKLAGLFGG